MGWDYIILDNPVRTWCIAIALVICCMVVARLFKSLVITRLKKISAHTKSSVDDFIAYILGDTVMPFLYLLSIYLGIQYLKTDGRVKRVLHVVALVVLIYFSIRVITKLAAYLLRNFLKKRHGHDDTIPQANGILLIANIVIWTIGIIFLIDNLGYSITTIITGLGIGGIAIALAAQTILGDLFSYFSIFFDKPFETGDFIIIGQQMGTVEHIGVKTTRLRALSGEQLIVANNDLTSSRVQNYKRMEKRRVVFSLGIEYETTPDKVKQVPEILKAIITNQRDTQLDRAHFTGFGESSLNFEVVYYILSADYNLYMDRQQSICLDILNTFEKEKIAFAYPTRRLVMEGSGLNTDMRENKIAV